MLLAASETPGQLEVGGQSVCGGMDASLETSNHQRVGHQVCVRVTTGAKVPDGFDAVVPVELTKLLEEADGVSTYRFTL